jgi:hypothetical protein
VPAPAPSTQSVTLAPVGKTDEALSRTVQGSGVPTGWSSLKSLGVPLSSNAPLTSSTISAPPLPQVRRSSA